ncbi:MAG: peptide chain release factor 2 [Acholeplasmataceae bacterium]
MEKYELYKHLEQFNESIETLFVSLKLDTLKERVNELMSIQLKPDFWNDVSYAKSIIEELNDKKDKVDTYETIKSTYLSIEELLEITDEGSEDYALIIEEVKSLSKMIKDFEVYTLLSGPYDKYDCYLELHPGAGGTESMDWGSMLYRMYVRYAQRKKYKVELIDYQDGEEAGIKSATLKIKGAYAYGNLKSEHGVHRLVRISPFDSNSRRHTSFVSCEVIPVFDDTIKIEVNDADLKVDVYRSSGAGGQSVNTTDSAVRITHLPTGIVVTCQNERSQIKNRETALSILKSKLAQLEAQKQQQNIDSLKGDQKDIAWGSQIRSYVFHPYQMVKDHRTNQETSQTDDVMDGDIDSFIKAYLKEIA